MSKKNLVLATIVASVSLIGSCREGSWKDSARDVSKSRELGEKVVDDPAIVPRRPPVNLKPAPNPPSFPNAATTGLTEEMCPDWENRKTNTSGRVITSPTVIEYEDIDGVLEIRSDNVVVRCSRIQSSFFWTYYVNGRNVITYHDLVLEDSFISPKGTSNTPQDKSGGIHQGQTLAISGAPGSAYLRNHVVAGCDGFKISGGFVKDTFIDKSTWAEGENWGTYCRENKGTHFDSMQMGGGSDGPVWVVNTTILGPWAAAGQAFHTGKYSTEQITLDGNLIGGGGYSLYTLRASVGKARVTNNTFLLGSTLFGPYYRDPVSSNLEMKVGGVHSNVWDRPDPAHNNQIIVDETYHPDIADAAEVGTQRLVPIPVWNISNFALERAGCTQGDALCKIDIRADASGNGTASNPPKTSSSHRWRYRCGVSTTELWHAAPSCDGQGTCEITDACDFQDASPGTYAVRMYSEPGPGAGVRPSDIDEATFAVN